MCFFARQSAQQGNPNAKSALEEIRNNSEIYHLRGGNNFAEKAKENEDLQQAQKLCLLGMTLAQAYHNGEKGEDDHKQAIEWIKQAAEMGYAEAQFCISKCYASGEVVEKDTQKSIEMLTKAAEQGHDEAQYFLGLFYDAGNGVEKDEKKAFEWHKKSAEQGFADAQYVLGACYHDGNGTERDSAKAIEWFNKAAEQENADAQYALGCMYYSGDGVDRNLEEAFKLFKKASEQGHPEAKKQVCNMLVDLDFDITKVYPQKSAKPTKPAASAANNEVSRQAVTNNHQNTESEKGFFGSIISTIKNIFR